MAASSWLIVRWTIGTTRFTTITIQVAVEETISVQSIAFFQRSLWHTGAAIVRPKPAILGATTDFTNMLMITAVRRHLVATRRLMIGRFINRQQLMIAATI